jgi:hypothetical protein
LQSSASGHAEIRLPVTVDSVYDFEAAGRDQGIQTDLQLSLRDKSSDGLVTSVASLDDIENLGCLQPHLDLDRVSVHLSERRRETS